MEDVYFPVFFSKLEDDSVGVDGFSLERGFLLRMVADIVNEIIEEINVPGDFALRVLENFKKSVGLVDFSSRGKSGLPMDSVQVNVHGYSVSILRDICAREDPSIGEDSGDVVGRLLSSGADLENQQVVADLELLGFVDVPELAGLGLKVEVDQQTCRAKLVNVAAKAS